MRVPTWRPCWQYFWHYYISEALENCNRIGANRDLITWKQACAQPTDIVDLAEKTLETLVQPPHP